MTVRRIGFCTLVVAALLMPERAHAQFFGGVFGAWAQDSFEGTTGAGAEIGYDLPVLPVDVFGAGTWFFPDCEGCELSGWSLGVNVRIPFPLIRPYVTGGMAWRNQEGQANAAVVEDNSGAFAGAGVDLAFAGVRLFGEARYEWLDGPQEQAIVRLGIMIR